MADKYKLGYIECDGEWCHWLVIGVMDNNIKGRSKGNKIDIEKRLMDWLDRTNKDTKVSTRGIKGI